VNFIEIENGITNLNFFHFIYNNVTFYWFQSSALISKWLAFQQEAFF
jgi:hypothetical protein